MYCLTRYEMKFNINDNEIIVPARTKCTVVKNLIMMVQILQVFK